MLIDKNKMIKETFKKRYDSHENYLTNMRNTNIFVGVISFVTENIREIETIKWNCAVCQINIDILGSNFSKLDVDDYLCKKCIEIPKSDALFNNVIKSSHNLFFNLQSRLRHNFKDVVLPIQPNLHKFRH